MIQREEQMKRIVAGLEKAFGKRLAFAGLQGSYLRGEATEYSDFDVMVVLDQLSIEDLQAYRAIIDELPDKEKACGFICGREELGHWPRYEIFQLQAGTKPYYGTLEGLLPRWEKQDIAQSISIATANLYHGLCHQYLYGAEDQRGEKLRPFYKAFFFILQLTTYSQRGRYYVTKKELRAALSQPEGEMLEMDMNWAEKKAEVSLNPHKYYRQLMAWCQKTLKTFG